MFNQRFSLARRAAGGIFALILLSFSQLSLAADIKVKISNVQIGKGKIYVEVLDRKAYEEEGDSTSLTKHTPSAKELDLVLTDIPEGEYTLVVYQDLNDNQDLDFSFISGPKEPIGVAHKQKLDYFPPDWKNVKFSSGIKDQVIEVYLYH